MRARRSLLALAALLIPSLLSAQKPPTVLVFGTAANGATGASGEAAQYRVTAMGAGVLTVVVFGESDLTLAVKDEDGQTLRDGTADRDFRGQVGAEYLAVPIPAAGTYGIEVRVNGGNAVAFRVIATFAAMSAFEMAPDPDGRPRNARSISAGAAREDQLHPDDGDLADWYVVTATQAMTLVVTTRVEEGTSGDFVLEAFLGEDLNDSVARSDQDLRGSGANESLTVDLKAGETVRIKVGSLSDSGGATPYRISVGSMP